MSSVSYVTKPFWYFRQS